MGFYGKVSNDDGDLLTLGLFRDDCSATTLNYESTEEIDGALKKSKRRK